MDSIGTFSYSGGVHSPNRQRGDKLGALHRRMGTTFKNGVHVTAKTLKAVRCSVATSINPDYGLDRLQMIKDRRERRAAA